MLYVTYACIYIYMYIYICMCAYGRFMMSWCDQKWPAIWFSGLSDRDTEHWKGNPGNTAWNMHCHGVIARNESSVWCANFSFHELQKLQIFVMFAGARRSQSGRSASRSYQMSEVYKALRIVRFWGFVGSEGLDARILAQTNLIIMYIFT